mmetsp:Transcript_11315/g.34658  ORF Transcript_11315/g.34658 Transcript_11315/m.34658 type:complete len:306 (+) Transcript_11315:43-960(+)
MSVPHRDAKHRRPPLGTLTQDELERELALRLRLLSCETAGAVSLDSLPDGGARLHARVAELRTELERRRASPSLSAVPDADAPTDRPSPRAAPPTSSATAATAIATNSSSSNRSAGDLPSAAHIEQQLRQLVIQSTLEANSTAIVADRFDQESAGECHSSSPRSSPMQAHSGSSRALRPAADPVSCGHGTRTATTAAPPPTITVHVETRPRARLTPPGENASATRTMVFLNTDESLRLDHEHYLREKEERIRRVRERISRETPSALAHVSASTLPIVHLDADADSATEGSVDCVPVSINNTTSLV